MKYQTFNRSCAYAGLANLLLSQHIDIDDRKLMIDNKITHLFLYDEKQKSYIAGPMIQSKEWFSYCINPFGFVFKEMSVSPKTLEEVLRTTTHKLMMSIVVDGSQHAVIYCGIRNNKYKFLNNKWKDSLEDEYYFFDLYTLKQKLVFTSPVGYIEETNEKSDMNLSLKIEESIHTLDRYLEDIKSFMNSTKTVEEQLEAKKTMFEALFLDVYSMLDILQENNLKNQLEVLRNQYIQSLKENKPMCLGDYLEVTEFTSLIDDLKALYKSVF